jgi:hypothetical protein
VRGVLSNSSLPPKPTLTTAALGGFDNSATTPAREYSLPPK